MAEQPVTVVNDVNVHVRQALLPQAPHGWVSVCDLCECVVVNAQAHAQVCPNREIADGR